MNGKVDGLYDELRGRMGWCRDLYDVMRCRFVHGHSYTKFRLIDSLRRAHGATTFIETGTFRGLTAARCAETFERVVTIELDEELADIAARRLRRHGNVQLLRGDAVELLPQLMQDQSVQNAIVFLDAHFSGGETAQGAVPEPALEELHVLMRAQTQCAAIVVDDFRSFGCEPGFPSKAQLIGQAEAGFPHPLWTLSVFLDQVIVSRNVGAPVFTGAT